MKIWITRHGQTNLNKDHLMQGRVDAPLNETGIAQAREARRKIGDVKFDKVYASPLLRAVRTASIIGNVSEDDVVRDARVIETDFGRYEKRPYGAIGLHMTLFWLLPSIVPAPKTVETIPHMKKRAASFLEDVIEDGRKNHYENILITCHGGIMRVLSGYMLGKRNGLMWYPKPHNCEIRIFCADPGKREMLADIKL